MHRGRCIVAFWLDAIALCPPTIAFIFYVSYLVNGNWRRSLDLAWDIGWPWHFYSFHQGITFIDRTAFWVDVIVISVFVLPTYYLSLRTIALRNRRRSGSRR